MNRPISIVEVRLGLRLIAKQPILSATIIMALATGICLAMIGFTFGTFSSTARCGASDPPGGPRGDTGDKPGGVAHAPTIQRGLRALGCGRHKAPSAE